MFQNHVQMGLVRELTDYKPTHTILSYIDASFWSEVTEFVIKFDERAYVAAKYRAMTIMTATSVAEVKPEGWIAGGHECRYCPFTQACGIERRNLPFADEEVDPQFAAEMREMARTLKEVERRRDFQEQHLRELQTDIKDRLRERGRPQDPTDVLTGRTSRAAELRHQGNSRSRHRSRR